MTDEELKKIHGDDVELAPDDTEDDHLTEEQALEQAKADGIEFVDTYSIEGHDETFDTLEEAEEAASKLKGKTNIIQTRSRKDG